MKQWTSLRTGNLILLHLACQPARASSKFIALIRGGCPSSYCVISRTQAHPKWSTSLDAGKLQSDKWSIKAFAFPGRMGEGEPGGGRDALRAERKGSDSCMASDPFAAKESAEGVYFCLLLWDSWSLSLFYQSLSVLCFVWPCWAWSWSSA